VRFATVIVQRVHFLVTMAKVFSDLRTFAICNVPQIIAAEHVISIVSRVSQPALEVHTEPL
jgi:hypothetical protein